MSDPASCYADSRTESRWSTSVQVLEVLVEHVAGIQSKNARGEMVDVSHGGAKLVLDSTIPIGNTVSLTVTSNRVGVEVKVSAHVCWMRSSAYHQWRVGCHFPENLTNDILARLATAGYLERRLDARYDHSRGLTARWQLSAEPARVHLRNLSAGGFSLFSPRHGNVGERVLLREDPDSATESVVIGKIQWQDGQPERYVIGCGFCTRCDYERLRRLTLPPES